MAEYKAGTLNIGTSTGNISVTGLSFQPKLVLFTIGLATSNSSTVTAGYSFASGYAIGTGATSAAQLAAGGAATDAADTTDTWSWSTPGKCVEMRNGAGTLLGSAALASFNSDGFTLNRTTAFSADYLVSYLAMGGSDIEVSAGEFQTITGPGDVTVAHGLTGGAPTCAMFWSIDGTTATKSAANSYWSWGATTGSGEEGAVQFRQRTLVASTDNASSVETNSALVGRPTTSLYHAQFSFSSFDSTNITLTQGTGTPNLYVFFLAVRGIQANASIQSLSGSGTGSFSTTETWTPGAAICLAPPPNNWTSSDAELSAGFTDGTSQTCTHVLDPSSLAASDNMSESRALLLVNRSRTGADTFAEDDTLSFSSWGQGDLNYTQTGSSTFSALVVLFEGSVMGDSETVEVTDTVAKASSAATEKTTSDTVEVTDTVAKTSAAATDKSTSDTVTVTDPSAVDVYRRTHELSETVTVTETLALGTGGPQISGALPGPKPVRYWDFDDLDDLRQALIDIDTWGSKATQLFPLRWEDVQADVRQGDFTSALTYEAYRDTPYIVGFMRWDQADELHLRFEMPNRWKPNTEVQVHIHVIPMVDPSSSPQVVSFSGQYAWGHVNSELVANASWTSFSKTFNVVTGDAFMEERIQLFTTTPTGSDGESILHVYLKRDGAAAPGGTDTYETSKASGTAQANLAIVSIDAHYQTDRRGSTS